MVWDESMFYFQAHVLTGIFELLRLMLWYWLRLLPTLCNFAPLAWVLSFPLAIILFWALMPYFD